MTDDPHTWPAIAYARLRDALSRPLDPDGHIMGGEPHRGAPGPSEPAPLPAHTHTTEPSGVLPHWLSTPAGGPNHPDTPHSAERSHPMETTPEQRRDAWVSLMGGLELTLTTTLGNAEASTKMAQAILDDTGHARPGFTPEDWDATAWAARKLLAQLRDIPAPVIPEDHSLGQATITDALAGLVRPSTPGDESVEEPGATVHPFPKKKGHW